MAIEMSIFLQVFLPNVNKNIWNIFESNILNVWLVDLERMFFSFCIQLIIAFRTLMEKVKKK